MFHKNYMCTAVQLYSNKDIVETWNLQPNMLKASADKDRESLVSCSINGKIFRCLPTRATLTYPYITSSYMVGTILSDNNLLLLQHFMYLTAHLVYIPCLQSICVNTAFYKTLYCIDYQFIGVSSSPIAISNALYKTVWLFAIFASLNMFIILY